MDLNQFPILSRDDSDFDLEEADYDETEYMSTGVVEDANLHESPDAGTELISDDSDGSHHDGDLTCVTSPEKQVYQEQWVDQCHSDSEVNIMMSYLENKIVYYP